MHIGALMSQPARRREATRFLKFATVGTLGAAIDYGVLNLLILVAGFPKFWANCCSFTVAVLSNFVWNRLWTFPESRERPLGSQLVQFAFINVIGLGINQVIFLSVDRYVLGLGGVWAPLTTQLSSAVGIGAAVLAYNLSKACATVVALFWNFGGNRLVTYRGL
ncbi:MAG: GtrA family protein [Anaerolineae bacterium]|nr:GtrA family protein [Anaerolineae bacterium]